MARTRILPYPWSFLLLIFYSLTLTLPLDYELPLAHAANSLQNSITAVLIPTMMVPYLEQSSKRCFSRCRWIIFLWHSFFFVSLFIYFWERERESVHTSKRGAERERERERENPKQAPPSQCRAWHGAWFHEPWEWTWAENKHLMLKHEPPKPPRHPFLFMWLGCIRCES